MKVKQEKGNKERPRDRCLLGREDLGKIQGRSIDLMEVQGFCVHECRRTKGPRGEGEDGGTRTTRCPEGV